MESSEADSEVRNALVQLVLVDWLHRAFFIFFCQGKYSYQVTHELLCNLLLLLRKIFNYEPLSTSNSTRSNFIEQTMLARIQLQFGGIRVSCYISYKSNCSVGAKKNRQNIENETTGAASKMHTAKLNRPYVDRI